MKKIFFIAGSLLFFGLAPTVFAQGFVPLAPIPGLTQGVTADSAGLATFFNNLYKFLIGIAAVLAVIEIIWGGLEISTQDSVSKNKDGKDRIWQAILGLVLVLSPVIVFSIINPSILNLSLNLPPLDTKSGAPTGSASIGSGTGTQASTSTGPTVAAATAGCNVTGTLLKKAVCPTQGAAQNFAKACSGSVSSSLLSSSYIGTCETTSGAITGPYTFIDTSQSGGFVGWFNTIVGYSYYEPIASNPTNPNNGTQVLQFASTCTADQGITCMSAVKIPIPLSACTYGTTSTSTPTVSYCWGISLSCTKEETGAGGCSSDPQFRVVP